MAKWIVVLSFEIPDDNAELLAEHIKQINPRRLEGFNGEIRLTTDPVATNIEEWLDE